MNGIRCFVILTYKEIKFGSEIHEFIGIYIYIYIYIFIYSGITSKDENKNLCWYDFRNTSHVNDSSGRVVWKIFLFYFI